MHGRRSFRMSMKQATFLAYRGVSLMIRVTAL
jgi:hypothetical protein